MPVLKEHFLNIVCLKYSTEEQYGHTPCRFLFNYPVPFSKTWSISRFPDSLPNSRIGADTTFFLTFLPFSTENTPPPVINLPGSSAASMSWNSECPTKPCGFADTESQDSSCRNHKKRIVYEKSTDGPLLSNHFQCSRSPAILSCVEMLQRACLLDA